MLDCKLIIDDAQLNCLKPQICICLIYLDKSVEIYLTQKFHASIFLQTFLNSADKFRRVAGFDLSRAKNGAPVWFCSKT